MLSPTRELEPFLRSSRASLHGGHRGGDGDGSTPAGAATAARAWAGRDGFDLAMCVMFLLGAVGFFLVMALLSSTRMS